MRAGANAVLMKTARDVVQATEQEKKRRLAYEGFYIALKADDTGTDCHHSLHIPEFTEEGLGTPIK